MNTLERARFERIEAALAEPMPDAEIAKERINYLCNSQSNEALDWRRNRFADPLLQLEEARFRYAIAVQNLRDEAAHLSAQHTKSPVTAKLRRT